MTVKIMANYVKLNMQMRPRDEKDAAAFKWPVFLSRCVLVHAPCVSFSMEKETRAYKYM